jgi:hypothetical protein
MENDVIHYDVFQGNNEASRHAEDGGYSMIHAYKYMYRHTKAATDSREDQL